MASIAIPATSFARFVKRRECRLVFPGAGFIPWILDFARTNPPQAKACATEVAPDKSSLLECLRMPNIVFPRTRKRNLKPLALFLRT
jgi:hypothetical protein